MLIDNYIKVLDIILSRFQEHDHIVKIDYIADVYKAHKGPGNILLEGGRRIRKTNRHNRIFEVSIFSPEGRLLLILLSNPKPIVYVSSVSFKIFLSASCARSSPTKGKGQRLFLVMRFRVQTLVAHA